MPFVTEKRQGAAANSAGRPGVMQWRGLDAPPAGKGVVKIFRGTAAPYFHQSESPCQKTRAKIFKKLQMDRKKKKPKSKLDTLNTIVKILAGIANIGFIVYQILKG